jgi:uncharacterized protein HemX
VRTPLKLAGLCACLAAGLLLATVVVGGIHAQDITTTETTTVEQTTTETATETQTQPTTVERTTTIERTTTRKIFVPATTTGASSESSTPAWVWVLLGVLAVALVIVIVLLAQRPRGGGGIPPAERRRRLDGAVASWTVQGWALESQTADSAVLQRGGERMLVSVDPAGQVGTRPI